ncbi:MAG: SufD family Fe-S cluster assembly protein [Clostridia bacterium]|nr:SufD family Fe-S cluster assembly protein [Clostridia bacterium]
MEKVKLNQTPVRTCRNFKINNIDFTDKIPSRIPDFHNVKIAQETGKDEIITDYEFDNFEVKFGSGLEDQIKEQANQKIKIDVKSKTDKEIKVEFDFDEENLKLVDYIEIVAEENTTSNIYIIYRNKLCNEVQDHCDDPSQRCSGVQCAPYKAYHNGLIRIVANNNSKVVVNIINLMNKESSNILGVDSKIEDSAKLKLNIVDFGAKTSVTNVYSNLAGKEANNLINSIYLGTDKEVIDMNYIAECFGEKSNINIDVQGALKDEAVKHFKGTIDFKKGCKKATGNEAENCMLLSDKAKSLALPMLLCSEEDVEGNHSASSGKADNKEIFYIMSRGFDKKSAEKLLVRAKFNSLLEGISNQEMKQEISYEMDQKLD